MWSEYVNPETLGIFIFREFLPQNTTGLIFIWLTLQEKEELGLLSLLRVFPSQHVSRHGKLHSLEVLRLSLLGGRVKDTFMDTFWILLISCI